MTVNIITLNKDVKDRNQFPKVANLLTAELQNATGYDITKSLKLQASVCKALTFWLEGFHKGLINIDFSTYYKKCIDKGWIRKEDAWLNLEFGYVDGKLKTEMADKFNIKIEGVSNYESFLEYVKNHNDFLGTLRIVSKTGGKHSLLCYKQGNNLYITDTSSRGTPDLFDKHINKDNFIYFTSMLTTA